ncbi:NIMA interactive protein [Aspergillus sclerotialis]|uniref:NIMA interactive protein n=1 Tax=Aspergillus sclerotialis TaxID=2070753 RepID=A0A3A2ZRQ0_9EURO|nr:NIMA interactive protein [Aspergillus sclerotialis]
MDPNNLQVASNYINNVLLARGLLRSGKPIDFAQPENEEGGSEATMARVINLVNDLVLRRDREADHRENLATTIRSLRANESQQTLEIEKLKTKTSELSRSIALAEGQERALKSNVSSAEATIRGLKEQAQRMKATVQQVRAQCANDIRKRDLELQKLKSHLADRQRGKREGLSVTTININPAVDRESRSKPLGGDGIHDPGYSLKQETNDFLTQLCQSLSDENDSLISLARNTIRTLNDLQGLPHAGEEEHTSGTASISTHQSSHGPVTTLPASCDELSSMMEKVLDHLRTLLTNPSFVPLEEVEIRDEEIRRLQDGWEKMESRWKQAVTMMDGWHKRISDGGDSVQIEELKMGLQLDALNAEQTSSSNVEPTAEPIFEDVQAEEAEESESRERDEPAENSRSRTGDSRGEQKTTGRALRERSDNIRGCSPRKVSFTPGLQDSPCEPDGEDDETLPIKAHKSETVTRRPRKKLDKPSRQDTRSTRMSVRQKLAAAEDEARAAEQSRKESETRKRSRAGRNMNSRTEDRRRSTLTNDELDGLMGMPSK